MIAQPGTRLHTRSGGVRATIAFGTVGALAVSTLAGIMMLRSLGNVPFESKAVLWFLPILLLLWAALFDEIRRRPYSLHLMHLIGVYVLLAAAPLYQVSIGEFPLAQQARAIPRYVLHANLAVAFWVGGYLIAYYIGSYRMRSRSEERPEPFLEREVSPRRIRFALLLTFPVFVYLLYLGLGGVVTRKAATASFLELESGPLYLINKVFLRAFPFVALGTGLLLVRRLRPLRSPLTAGLVAAVLVAATYADNPLASGRYWTVSILLGLAAPHLLRRRATGTLLLAAAIGGLTILPALGATRRAESGSELVRQLQAQSLPSPVLYLATHGDVAAYGVLNLGLRWIDLRGHSWGRQTLGALLFWFPRSFWPDKPIATGVQITKDFGFEFTVISAPIMTEPLVDFGLAGVPIFAILFGTLLAYLDAVYWAGGGIRVRVVDTFYPFLLGMLLLLTRGNLMSALAFTTGFVASSLPLVLLLKPPFRRDFLESDGSEERATTPDPTEGGEWEALPTREQHGG